MNPGKRPFYSCRPRSGGSPDSPDQEKVVIDITRAVRRFINAVDSQVGPGYDVRGVISEYSAYLDGSGDDIDSSALAHRLLMMGYARRLSDANFIADRAIRQLYVEITQEIKDQGYIAGTVVEVDFKNVRRTNSIHCQVVLTVV